MINRTLPLLFLTIIGYACCFSTKKQQALSSVELYYHLQLARPDGVLMHYTDSLTITGNGIYTIYKYPKLTIFTSTQLNKTNDTLFEKEDSRSVSYRYIVYHNNDKWGYQYDSLASPRPRRIDIDSFQRGSALKNFPLYSKTLKIKYRRTDKNGDLIEKMAEGHKPDLSYYDSSFYYYSKRFNDAPYSFSSLLDSTHKLKLYKVRLIYNPIKKGPYLADIPRQEYYFELRKADVPPEIPALLEKFKLFEAKQQ